MAKKIWRARMEVPGTVGQESDNPDASVTLLPEPASSTQSDLSLTPLNLSTDNNRTLDGVGQSSAMNRQFETNFLYSDTNPLCVQLYLQAVGRSKGRPHKSLQTPGSGRKDNKRLRRLAIRRERDAEERCREFWVRAKLYRLEQRQLALNSRLQLLMDTKLALLQQLQEVQNFFQLHMDENRPAWVNEMLSAALPE